MLLNWLSGALVGVGGSDVIGYELLEAAECGQSSEVQSGKTSPAPGRSGLSKGLLKSTQAMVLGFETLNLKNVAN